MSNEVEEARAVLHWASSRSSIRAIADAVGVEQSVLNRFIAGKAKKPRPDVLAKLLPYVARRRAEYARATSESATDHNTAPDASAYRQIPISELAYWRGVIETEHRHLHGLTQSMDALLGMLRSATDGIGGFIASGALPAPRGPVGRPVMTEADVEAQVAAIKRQDAADAERAARSA